MWAIHIEAFNKPVARLVLQKVKEPQQSTRPVLFYDWLAVWMENLLTNENDERAFLEAQLQWVKQRDALLEQNEKKLYEMKHIAEQVASSDTFMLESQKYKLNERFLH